MGLLGNTHLVAGGPEVIPQALALLEQEGIETRGNPDLYVRTYRRFGIDEARELILRASARAIAGGRRVFVVATPAMTHEAQNALLKTLEEPPADALFFFIVPAPQVLLPTLRSRAQILSFEPSAGGLPDARKFLSATAQMRLDMLKPLLEKDEDEKRDAGAIIAFLSSLERVVATHAKAGRMRGVEAVYRARKYVGDRGALVKPLLEQVALLTPHI